MLLEAPELPELVLPEETLDMDMTECGLLVVLHCSVTGPATEFLNLGAAKKISCFIDQCQLNQFVTYFYTIVQH